MMRGELSYLLKKSTLQALENMNKIDFFLSTNLERKVKLFFIKIIEISKSTLCYVIKKKNNTIINNDLKIIITNTQSVVKSF